MSEVNADDSMTAWLIGLKEGDERAIEQLWNRCFNDLVHMARNRFGDLPLRAEDEEDAALSVMASLCRGAAAGRFERLNSKDDLWPLLVALTRQKVVDRIRAATRQKRGGGQVRGESVFQHANGGTGQAGLNNVDADSLGPEFLVDLNDQVSKVMNQLPDDTAKKIATLRLEGLTNEEIGTSLGVSEAAVRRKLRIVRDTWNRIATGD